VHVVHDGRGMIGLLAKLLGRPAAAPSPPIEPADAEAAPPLAAPVHVLLDDAVVRLVDGHLAVAVPEAPERRVRLDEVGQLSLFGAASVTSPCLRELMRRGIPVVWRAHGGHYVGQSADLSGRSAAARRAQYRAADDPVRALAIARTLVRAKIINARGLVRRGAENAPAALDALGRLARQAGEAASLPALLGTEGAAAAAFYAVLPELIAAARRPDFPWDGRRRRPPADALNALLSYLYAVLAGECAAAALAAGLDPAVGFLHAERAGRPALALDLMEPFRPLIADAAALAVVNRGEVRPEHFVASAAGVRLDDRGRRIVLDALERRLADPVPARADRERSRREEQRTWREAVAVQARTLSAALKSGARFSSFESP
jgi:CRISPR-associated endonuclease Cas1